MVGEQNMHWCGAGGDDESTNRAITIASLGNSLLIGGGMSIYLIDLWRSIILYFLLIFLFFIFVVHL